MLEAQFDEERVHRFESVDNAAVTATVGIGPRQEGGFGLAIGLSIAVPGVPRDQVQTLAEKPHQVCPYSNTTRDNIDVKLTVE